jgi:hypothetical protein
LSTIRAVKQSGLTNVRTLFKLFLLGGLAFFVVILLSSGLIGYLLYTLSSESPSSEVPTINLPRWDEMPKAPKEILVASGILFAVFWVLGGNIGFQEEEEEKKDDSRKGRARKRNSEED